MVILFKNTQQSGFTLVELLVVIAIIGLLSSVVLVSLDNARKKARDAKRKSELKQMKAPLEHYYNDNGEYPPETYCDSSRGACGHSCPCSGNSWDTNSSFYKAFVGNDYVSTLPEDPLNNSNYYYSYESSNDGNQGYYFRARLETGGYWGICGGTLFNNWSWCH